MQTIGICRFSYPAIGGFQVTHADTAEREAYLYSPERMSERFALFETLTLPCLRAQTESNFTLVVVVGSSLPAAYRKRLDEVLTSLPQAVVIALPPMQHRKAMRKVINDARRFDDQPCLQFRLDDDDAVGVNFVERLSETGHDLRDVSARHGMIGVDFSRGYIVRATAQGLHAAATTSPLSTAGLGVMVPPDDPRTVMNFAHHKLERVMPVLRFKDEDMLIRSHNSHNDSRQKPSARHIELLPVDRATEPLFHTRFNIDADLIRRVFSSLE